ncbi:MAG: hypothetical protein IJ112_08245 [Oscillospiraceae bacterium]|nr:hypothetical protein [Oscillospiraceae bacterium]
MENILETNQQRIDERLKAGLELLRKNYRVEACPVDPALADPLIGGRPHHAQRYNIAGVGNLLVMTVKEAETNQLSSFVLMPYAKNLPLFSTDYVYAGEKRFFLLEIYDLSVRQDADFAAGIEAFRAFGDTLTALQDFPTRPAWYDSIRPVCWAKTYGPEQDNFALERFLQFLKLFIEMDQAAQPLSDDERMEKWKKNKAYADQLIDAGGVSTDLFTAALGAENTRRFFHEVFFGANWYKPSRFPTRQIAAFLDRRDEEGVSNREKLQKHQHVIRRVATTDKSKSYEDAEDAASDGLFPAGVVLQDGRLIGFGIHIFNEDIYPLQSFEIYFRSCGLGGPVDLSGCGDLLFVDLYHNAIEGIDVSGDGELRILGLQDNLIRELDVRDLKRCQGIDAGKNRLSELDVSKNGELVELYINDNAFTAIDLSRNPKLKYFYCHNNRITDLDTTANPLLRHLDATGNPMKRIRALAPQQDEALPLSLTAEGPGKVGLKFNPVYNAQWKETGEWKQTYFAYPEPGASFLGWYDEQGTRISKELAFEDEYGSSRMLIARFV